MQRRALIGALLLVGVGVVLGTTVFRADIAQATGLAQSVTVANTASNAVPVREQNLDGGNIKVHEQGTASTANVDVRTAVRYGPTNVGPNSPTPIVPTVSAGKTFVATYVNVLGVTSDPADQLVSGNCSLRLFSNNQDAPMGSIPLVANVGAETVLAGSEQAFLPVNSGESIGLLCSGKGANGDFPNSKFFVNVGGYFIPG